MCAVVEAERDLRQALERKEMGRVMSKKACPPCTTDSSNRNRNRNPERNKVFDCGRKDTQQGNPAPQPLVLVSARPAGYV